MKLSVIGTGYLGAVHAACMAQIGHEVVAYDTDASKIAQLSTGTSPFYEPGFDELLAEVLATGRLRFTQSVQEAVSGASVHFVCVGTPQLAGSDAANIEYVDSAFRTVAANADCDGLIIGKSTVPVGTAQRLSGEVAQADSPHRLEVAWNPGSSGRARPSRTPSSRTAWSSVSRPSTRRRRCWRCTAASSRPGPRI